MVLSHDERCCFASGICYCSQEQFYCCIQTICCIMLYHDIILWSQMNSFLLVTYRKVHMFSKFCPHLKKLTLLLVERLIVFTVLIFVVLMILCSYINISLSLNQEKHITIKSDEYIVSEVKGHNFRTDTAHKDDTVLHVIML